MDSWSEEEVRQFNSSIEFGADTWLDDGDDRKLNHIEQRNSRTLSSADMWNADTTLSGWIKKVFSSSVPIKEMCLSQAPFIVEEGMSEWSEQQWSMVVGLVRENVGVIHPQCPVVNMMFYTFREFIYCRDNVEYSNFACGVPSFLDSDDPENHWKEILLSVYRPLERLAEEPADIQSWDKVEHYLPGAILSMWD